MRRQISKMLMACVMTMTLMVVSAASAFAAGTGWTGAVTARSRYRAWA